MSNAYDADLEDLVEDEEPEDDLEVEDEAPEDYDEPPKEPEEGDEGDEPPAQQARQPSRAERRIQALANEAKEAKAKTELLERQLHELSQRQAAPLQPTQQQIDAHLATLEPWDRTEFLRQQDAQRTEQTLRNMAFRQQEQSDKLAYESLKLRAPVAGKLEREVEQRLAEMRAAGTTAPRETVLRWVIGDRALANANRATGRAQRTATTNRERQQARPTNSRGDQTPSNPRDNNARSRDKRLENVSI